MGTKTRWAALAAVCVIVAGGGWLLGRSRTPSPAVDVAAAPSEAPVLEAASPRVAGKTPGPCAGLVDGDGDERVDGHDDSRWTFLYDARQRLEAIEIDYRMDGHVDARTELQRDVDGWPLGERFDCDADGRFEEQFTYVTDRDGRKRVAVLAFAEGHTELCLGQEHRESFASREGTAAVDGMRRDWEAILRSLGVEDATALEPIDGVVQYLYGPDGLLVAEEWDMDANGVVEEIIRFEYDDAGNLATEVHDDGPDGTIDVSVIYDHGCWTDGRASQDGDPPESPCGGSWDLDGSGNVDGYTRNVYDERGLLVLVHADWDVDGVVDNRFHYTYDAAGRRLTEEWETALDGSREEVVTLHYDAASRRIRGDIDAHCDGTVDGRVTYEHDEAGRLSKENWDKDGDGALDEILTYTYGADGRLVSAFYDDLQGAQPDETVTWLYDCAELRIP